MLPKRAVTNYWFLSLACRNEFALKSRCQGRKGYQLKVIKQNNKNKNQTCYKSPSVELVGKDNRQVDDGNNHDICQYSS